MGVCQSLASCRDGRTEKAKGVLRLHIKGNLFHNLRRTQVVRPAVKGKLEVLHSVTYCQGLDSTTIIYILFIFQ